MRDGSGANAGESGLISTSFGVHGALSCCCGDLRVPLDMLQCCWGFPRVPLRKSRHHSFFIRNTELLCTQCSGTETHLVVRGKSYAFYRVVAVSWGIFSSYGLDGLSKLVFDQRLQDSCLVVRDNSGFSTRLGRSIGKPFKVKQETQSPFPFATEILGFVSIYKKSQASSPFEALKSTYLSRCQWDVRHPVEMSRGPRAFSRVYTRYSGIPSSFEMKDEPAFK